MEITKEELLDCLPSEWSNFKSFIDESNKCYYANFNGWLIIDELELGNREYMVEVNMESGEIQFTDDLVDLSSVVHYHKNIDVDSWKERHEKLKEEIEKLGFDFRESRAGGSDDFVWYNLTINANKFTQEALDRATLLWSHYNKKSRELLNK